MKEVYFLLVGMLLGIVLMLVYREFLNEICNALIDNQDELLNEIEKINNK